MLISWDFSISAPDRIRTCGLSVRSRTLYPLSYGCIEGRRATFIISLHCLFYMELEEMSNVSLPQNVTS